MAEKDVLIALRRHRERLREPLDPVARRLADLLAELERSADPEEVWARLSMLLLRVLPADDEVTGLLLEADVHRSAAVAEPMTAGEVRAEARRLLAELFPSTEEVVARAKARLLSAPARDASGLEDRSGLILLPAPDGSVRAPAFQFASSGEVRPVVREVNRLLGADRDAWSAADWWLGPDSALGGRPAELIGTVADDRLIAVARAVRAVF